jgi:hypothetical protein
MMGLCNTDDHPKVNKALNVLYTAGEPVMHKYLYVLCLINRHASFTVYTAQTVHST